MQSLVEAAHKDKISGAITTIKELTQLHGITVEDLATGSRAKPAKAKGLVPAQFKNPETGETWTGRGRTPRWFDGKDREAYRIAN